VKDAQESVSERVLKFHVKLHNVASDCTSLLLTRPRAVSAASKLLSAEGYCAGLLPALSSSSTRGQPLDRAHLLGAGVACNCPAGPRPASMTRLTLYFLETSCYGVCEQALLLRGMEGEIG